MPVSVLSYDIRRELALLLDVPSMGHDWRSFADRLGLQYKEIRHMERNEYPTLAVLDKWETEGDYVATVGKMLSVLGELNRKDAIAMLTEKLLDI